MRTVGGRKLWLPGIDSKHPDLVADAERQATNYPVQGSAGDITKRAMIDVRNELGLVPIIQVHDELVYELPEDTAYELAEQIAEIMIQAGPNLGHPYLELPVEIGIGKRWSDVK